MTWLTLHNFRVHLLALLAALALPLAAQEVTTVNFAPTRYQNMYEFYQQNKEAGRPTLVTSDSVLHTAHILFDFTLRAAELEHFNKNLEQLTSAMQSRMVVLARTEASKRNTQALPPYGYDRVAAYFGVAAKLLNPDAQTPEIIRPLVEQEIALIQAHNTTAISPIMGVSEDYTQYVPRGHYTRNDQFKRYFLAMMWYGRAGFPISGEKSPGVRLTVDEARANAWAGITLARAIDKSPLFRNPNSPTYLGLWQSIYQPTQFLVGTSDDLTPPEYAALSTKVFGDMLPSAWTKESKAKTDQFIAEAIKLRKPQILGTVQVSTAKAPPVSVRFFGQRYTPDSNIFQRLVDDYVLNRDMPSGLDVMAALGSPTAESLLRERGEFKYQGYGKELAALQADINAFGDAQWQQTAYTLWLRTLRDLLVEQPAKGQRAMQYPDWWTSPAWKAKQLNTALGSWAELRHDTILYVKQSYTVLRSAMIPQLPKQPIVYVEPVPEVYNDLRVMLTAVRNHLTAQGVFPQEMAANYTAFDHLLGKLALVSASSLHPAPNRLGIDLSIAQNEPDVQNIGDILQTVETLPAPLRAELTGREDTQMAVIADVHTDPNSGKVLEVGVGKVMQVSVPMNYLGKSYTLSGPIFSYYEFTQPMDARMTDADWQKKLLEGTAGAPMILQPYLPKGQ